MSFIETFMDGEKSLFKPETLTPMQKLTLRFVVVGLLYYGFAVVEGMIMRIYQVTPLPSAGRRASPRGCSGFGVARKAGARVAVAYIWKA